MGDREFEELTKAMADGRSRRGIVKILGGGLLSSVVGLFTARGGETAPRRRRRAGAAAATTTTTKRPTTTTTTKRPTTTTTTKRPTTTTTTKRPTTTTTTKRPTTTTTTKKPNGVVDCFHSEGPNGGCKGACAAAGFTGRECNPICGTGQIEGFCPVGQGGGNPCCNPGLCNPANFRRVGGVVTYVGPTAGCNGASRQRNRD